MPVSQEELDAKLEEYFSILDPLSQRNLWSFLLSPILRKFLWFLYLPNFIISKSILSEIESVKKSSPVWDSLSQKEKDKLVDSHFVPKEIRKRYAKDNAKKGILGLNFSDFSSKIKDPEIERFWKWTAMKVDNPESRRPWKWTTLKVDGHESRRLKVDSTKSGRQASFRPLSPTFHFLSHIKWLISFKKGRRKWTKSS